MQGSMNNSLDLLKCVLVILLPQPRYFGFLVILSFGFVSSGYGSRENKKADIACYYSYTADYSFFNVSGGLCMHFIPANKEDTSFISPS